MPRAPLASAAWVVASALLCLLALPPIGFWPAALVATAPLVPALRGQGPGAGLVLGWLHGLTLGSMGGRFLLEPLLAEFGVATAPSVVFLVLFIGFYAAIHGTGFWLFALAAPRIQGAALPVTLGACLALGEWLRGAIFMAPWLLLAHGAVDTPVLLQGAALGGPWLVSFVLASLGAGLGKAILDTAPGAGVVGAVPLVALLAFGVVRASVPPVEGELDVVVVQASVPQSERFQPLSAWRNARRHAALTRPLQRNERPDLVVWSENSVDADLDRGQGLVRLLAKVAGELEAPLVTGAPRTLRARSHNTVVLVTGAGIRETYAKQQLVPFSESDPWWGAPLSWLIGPVVQGTPYVAGTDATVFRQGPAPFSAPICFEISDAEAMRRFRSAGAELLLNLSNDAWFGHTAFSAHHLLQARFRAVELGIWVVRAANTGISAFVDPRGAVRGSMGLFEEGTLRSRIGPAETPPVYARVGDMPVVAGLLAVVGGAVAAGRRSEDASADAPEDPDASA